jgi:hypothetical protein
MRSNFERQLARKLKGCDYEPAEHVKPYTYQSTYLPDFVPKQEPNILIEAKGNFRTRQEASKYIAVRDCHPDIEIVFVFMNPNTPMPNSRKRRDGTRFSMAEWADKNGFLWYTIKTIPKRWCKRC